MSPEQALQLLDNAVSQMVLNRADHQKLANAVMILKSHLSEGKDGDSIS